jgi:hypothetical protein
MFETNYSEGQSEEGISILDILKQYWDDWFARNEMHAPWPAASIKEPERMQVAMSCMIERLLPHWKGFWNLDLPLKDILERLFSDTIFFKDKSYWEVSVYFVEFYPWPTEKLTVPRVKIPPGNWGDPVYDMLESLVPPSGTEGGHPNLTRRQQVDLLWWYFRALPTPDTESYPLLAHAQHYKPFMEKWLTHSNQINLMEYLMNSLPTATCSSNFREEGAQ